MTYQYIKMNIMMGYLHDGISMQIQTHCGARSALENLKVEICL